MLPLAPREHCDNGCGSCPRGRDRLHGLCQKAPGRPTAAHTTRKLCWSWPQHCCTPGQAAPALTHGPSTSPTQTPLPHQGHHEVSAAHKQEPLPWGRNTQAFTPLRFHLLHNPWTQGEGTSTTHQGICHPQSLLVAAHMTTQPSPKQSTQINRSCQHTNQTPRPTLHPTRCKREKNSGQGGGLPDWRCCRGGRPTGPQQTVEEAPHHPQTESNTTAHHKKFLSEPRRQMHKKLGIKT